METAVKRLYEGMFLVDSGLAAQDWQAVLDEIQRVMDRAGAEVVSLKKWDDRRLAYSMQRTTRGTYILVYFNCETDKVKDIERDVQLSEILMRTLILRGDQMSTEDMEKATPLEAQAQESDKDEASAPEKDADDADQDDNDDDDVEDTEDDKEA